MMLIFKFDLVAGEQSDFADHQNTVELAYVRLSSCWQCAFSA